MYSLVYLILLAISVVNAIILVKISEYRQITPFLLLAGTVTVSMFGYLGITISTVTQEALFANRLTYLCGTFGMFFLFMCICSILGVHVPKAVVTIWLLADMELYAATWIPGAYYKSANLYHESGYAYLVKEYAFHHTIYFVAVAIEACISFGVILASLKRQERTSWLYTVLLGTAEVLSVVLYFGERALGLKIEFLPFTYLVIEIIMLIILARISVYDSQKILSETVKNTFTLGAVILDAQKRFVDCDENAKVLFPELSVLKKDRTVTDPLLISEFNEWVDESLKHNVKPKFYQRKGIDIKIEVAPFYNKSKTKHMGYVFRLTDDSNNQQHIRRLTQMSKAAEEAADAAEAAADAKGKFMSAMSHEIRTPVNAILGFDEMILRESNQPEITSYARDIQSAGSTLLTIIGDFLDFSKIEAGRMEVVSVEYNVASMLKDVVSLVQQRAADKGLELVVDVSNLLPGVLYGDVNKIKQVITNLLTNAVKYTEKGRVRLRVDFDESASPEEILLNVWVSDTGIGMTKDTLNKIFMPFERFDLVKNKQVEGTGLGLVISRKFLELMESSLDVKSIYGEGSTFSFSMRQDVVDKTPLGDFTEAVEKLKEEKHDYRVAFTAPDARVLVVDDTPINITVFRALLKKTLLSIDEATTAKAAIGHINETKYDMIFIDHYMPETDGIKLLSHIKEDNESVNKETPVIVMSAGLPEGALESYEALKPAGYLTKPILYNLLEETIIKNLPADKVSV
ncbi:MAG: response regulator [Lachnospiraceae bacterium]|nr:response regulator [Lachnospiraceae bacterium]